MLYLIGIGLNDEKDITLKGLDAIEKSDTVYLEDYTSRLNTNIGSLEKLYNKKIIRADRQLVELEAEKTILKDAKQGNAAFLVIGDVMSATTHIDLYLRAKREGISVRVIHNASVLTAVGVTGLELYKFGRSTSIPFDNKNIISPVQAYNANYKLGLHTLFLLDLDTARNRLMSAAQAAEYLISNKIRKETKAVACCALGSIEPYIKYATLEDISIIRVDRFPQCLIMPGKLHFIEEEALNLHS